MTNNIIKIKVLFFASARVAVGNIKETIIELNTDNNDNQYDNNNPNEQQQLVDVDTATSSTTPIPKSPNTNTIRYTLAKLYPNLSSLVLDEESITLALNEEYVSYGEVLLLKDGDVIALIPPISGG